MEIGKLEKSGLWLKTKKGLWWVDPLLEKSVDPGVAGLLFSSGELDASDVAYGKLIIRGPGDYEVGGVEVKGFSGGKGTLETIYRVRADSLGIVLANSFSDKWDDKRVEKLGSNDVLVLGVDKMTVKRCKEIVKKMGVNYLILWGESEALKKFADEFDLESLRQDKVKIEAESLPEGLEVVILNG
ncbi:MAG: hypothetical protein WCV93_03660 [Candidatus Shapirobacteria bacterium]|jgi:hypothetical protein